MQYEVNTVGRDSCKTLPKMWQTLYTGDAFSSRLSICDSSTHTSNSPCIAWLSRLNTGNFFLHFLRGMKYLGSIIPYQTTWAVFLPLSNEWQQAILRSCHKWVFAVTSSGRVLLFVTAKDIYLVRGKGRKFITRWKWAKLRQLAC